MRINNIHMVNAYAAKMSRLRAGVNKTSDIAILETQIMISRLFTQPTQEEEERIQKFKNIDDALDALEDLILGKIKLGDKEWISYHNVVKKNLADTNLCYRNLEKYRKLINMRYQLYNIVLQSLGYYTTEIIRNEAYDQLGYNALGQEQM